MEKQQPNFIPFDNPRNFKHVQVRLSNTLLERMKWLAEQHNRSLNGEIVQALQEFNERHEKNDDQVL